VQVSEPKKKLKIIFLKFIYSSYCTFYSDFINTISYINMTQMR
jgi:hypothetical protein